MKFLSSIKILNKISTYNCNEPGGLLKRIIFFFINILNGHTPHLDFIKGKNAGKEKIIMQQNKKLPKPLLLLWPELRTFDFTRVGKL